MSTVQGATGICGNLTSGLVVGGGGVQPFDFVQSLPPTVQTGAIVFQNKLTLVLNNKPPGTYQLRWRFLWNHNVSGSQSFRSRVQLDGVNIGDPLSTNAQLWAPFFAGGSSEPTGSGSGTGQAFPQGGGFEYIALACPVHTVTLDFTRTTTLFAAAIWNACMYAYRISQPGGIPWPHHNPTDRLAPSYVSRPR